MRNSDIDVDGNYYLPESIVIVFGLLEVLAAGFCEIFELAESERNFCFFS